MFCRSASVQIRRCYVGCSKHGVQDRGDEKKSTCATLGRGYSSSRVRFSQRIFYLISRQLCIWQSLNSSKMDRHLSLICRSQFSDGGGIASDVSPAGRDLDLYSVLSSGRVSQGREQRSILPHSVRANFTSGGRSRGRGGHPRGIWVSHWGQYAPLRRKTAAGVAARM